MVKKSTSSSAKQTVSIIKPMKKEDTISISVRLPKPLHSRFTAIQRLLEKYEYTMSITDVVKSAMENACETAIRELEGKGIDVRQEDLPK